MRDKPSLVQAVQTVSETSDAELDRGRGKKSVSDIDFGIPGKQSSLFRNPVSIVQDLLEYRKTKYRFRELTWDFDRLFQRFLCIGRDGKGLYLKDADERHGDFQNQLGPNWVTLSLDHVERRTKEPGKAIIDLAENYFDAVLCTGLERVSMPAAVVAEVRRVLKRSGELWVQAPLSLPYAPTGTESLKEYWRFTPDGLRTLLDGFDEILCSVYVPPRCMLRNYSVFYGLKPEIEG